MVGRNSILAAALAAAGACVRVAEDVDEPVRAAAAAPARSLLDQSPAQALEKSAGCVACHAGYVDGSDGAASPGSLVDDSDMHRSPAVHLGCVDCHGGDARLPEDGSEPAKESAHPRAADGSALPRLVELWSRDGELSAANPERSAAATLAEDLAWIRFVNPGDLRAAPLSCGTARCHEDVVARVRSSMMAHGSMLWGAALYNNGAVPHKDARYGEAYAEDGTAARLVARAAPTEKERRELGRLPELWPLPRWEISQPGNVLRVFERGGRRKPEPALQNPFEPPGDPEVKLGNRGYGALVRTDPVLLGLQKTRLLDPTLNFFGTNDHAGDYRASGCSACHVLYANDRNPLHSGALARYGNDGRSFSADPTIRPAAGDGSDAAGTEPGHPVKHVFTRAIPSSQCIVCHVHPGTSVTNSYLGTIWWDNETDGERLYPQPLAHSAPGSLAPDGGRDGGYPDQSPGSRRTAEEIDAIERHNPEGAAVRGLWGDREFLAQTGTPEFNATLEHTRLADFHGHGWLFRNVYRRDRHGNLLDRQGAVIPDESGIGASVHLMDIHLEKGMHCADCHFERDSHGTGHLHGEMRAAIEIGCSDCHGTIRERATLVTSGPAAPRAGDGRVLGTHLEALTTPFGERRFFRRGERIFQRSVVEPGVTWELVQVLDTITEGSPRFNARSARAKTLRRDGENHGGCPDDERELAHRDSRMSCTACHTSWTTSCFGCHLPMTANRFKPNLHSEGQRARNWTSYDFQTLRDDVYMLGIDGTVTGNRVSPARSACAVLVSSQNEDREWIYSQQQTISAEGFSGQAFSTYVPHTVRGSDGTKTCSDCHVSAANDNNAWMAQLLLLGTNQTNFIGRLCWVGAGEGGFEAVVVTERDEPQAVIGSNLHRIAYPERHAAHEARGRRLETSVEHPPDDVLDRLIPGGGGRVLSLQARGEYVYAACGPGGLRVFDVANVDNKGLSEKTVSAPVSPLGQRFHVPTRDARAVASPSTTALDPGRSRRPENEEQPIHLLYAFLYVADFEEGLILVNAATLLDGNPQNNLLERTVVTHPDGTTGDAFNPGGVLDGAVNVVTAGEVAWVCCARGLVAVSLSDPLAPRVLAVVGAPQVEAPTAVQVQFRYAFVSDARGLRVVEVTDPAQPRALDGATVPIEGARSVYVARTHAYVAAGARGIAIVDVERPEAPLLEQWFDAGGAIDDAHDVKIGMTNNSTFGYVADGVNGLRVIELVTSGVTPGFAGFTQRPTPRLIATFETHGPALAISEGLERDRAVDESGNQLSVFNRRGARPFTLEEMQRLYLRDGRLFTVSDEPPAADPTTRAEESR